MPSERFPPDDPRQWLARAKSDLAIAAADIEDAYLEDLCFHAQQAAEKSLKSLFLHLGVPFPRIHDLTELVRRLEEAGQIVPSGVRESVRLTDYAVGARYPGVSEIVTEEEWREAVALAREVLHWVEHLLL